MANPIVDSPNGKNHGEKPSHRQVPVPALDLEFAAGLATEALQHLQLAQCHADVDIRTQADVLAKLANGAYAAHESTAAEATGGFLLDLLDRLNADLSRATTALVELQTAIKASADGAS